MFVFRCLLLAVCCLLFVVSRSLFVALFVARYFLFAFLLFAVCGSLRVVVRCGLFVICCVLFGVACCS